MSRCEASGIDTRHALFAARAAKFHISRDRSDEGQGSGLPMTTNFGSVTCRSRVLRRLVIMGMSLTPFSLGPPGSQREEPTAGPTIDAVVERIIGVESNGDPSAKNKRSSATVAILSAMENADAALVMATADVTGRTKREKIVKANPFLERFTVADLRTWADRKMR